MKEKNLLAEYNPNVEKDLNVESCLKNQLRSIINSLGSMEDVNYFLQ